MVFLENFRIALGALRANMMRSILTTLGIIIGVAAVIARGLDRPGAPVHHHPAAPGGGRHLHRRLGEERPRQHPRPRRPAGQAHLRGRPGDRGAGPRRQADVAVHPRPRRRQVQGPQAQPVHDHRGDRELPGRHQPDRRPRALLLPGRPRQPPQGDRRRPQDRRRAEPGARSAGQGDLHRHLSGDRDRRHGEEGAEPGDGLRRHRLRPLQHGGQPVRPQRRRPGAGPPPGGQRGERARRSRTASPGCCGSATRSPPASPTTSRSRPRTRSSRRSTASSAASPPWSAAWSASPCWWAASAS